MDNNGAGGPKAVVAFAPKLDGNFDQLDKAGHTVLDAVRQAADAAETKYLQTAEANRKLSAQLQSAQDRIKELEGMARHQHDRAERAEKWLYQISVEIEQKFFERR